jgi:hypothetical protein
MVRRGIPDAVAMKLAGHQTRSVFDRYSQVIYTEYRPEKKNVPWG